MYPAFQDTEAFPTIRTLTETMPDPIVDASGGTTTYYGYSLLGTDPNAPGWKIKRVVVSGGITTPTYANGSMNYDQIWTNRTSLSYSR